MSMSPQLLRNIIEGALLASEKPLSIDRILNLFSEEEQVSREMVREALELIEQTCEDRGVELKEVSSGFRMQVRSECAAWVSRLWEERPQRYSRALYETLVLIAYRQPVTRAEIEDVRGVAVSSQIIKTLQEREWIRVLGHREVPGRPALYGTTRQFLDYFNLKSLEDLPTLKEIADLDDINLALDLEGDIPADTDASETKATDAEEGTSASVDESNTNTMDESGSQEEEELSATPTENELEEQSITDARDVDDGATDPVSENKEERGEVVEEEQERRLMPSPEAQSEMNEQELKHEDNTSSDRPQGPEQKAMANG